GRGARVELLVGRSFGQLAARELRGYVARVFDLIVFIARVRGGRRCVLEVVELWGLREDGDYDLRTVVRTDVEHDGEEHRPVFCAMPDYRPWQRLARKLELEGL